MAVGLVGCGLVTGPNNWHVFRWLLLCMLATSHIPVLARVHWGWVYYCYCWYRPLLIKKWQKTRKRRPRPLQAPVEPPYVFVCKTQTHMT